MQDKNFKLCFIVPVYKHVSTLEQLLERLKIFNLPVVVIDDGNSKEDHVILEQICSHYPSFTDEHYDMFSLHLLSYPLNQGKGCAVCQGFMWAYNQGFSHALQIDADLQHDINDVPKFVSLAQAYPQALISGKPVYNNSIPKARLYGRKITDFWVAIETLSLSLKDSMCGYRVYPLAHTIACIKELGFKRKMDFDTDLMVKLYRRGMDVLYIDTKVIYPQGGHSNFQAIKDNIAISLMHTSLVLSLPWYIKPLLARKFQSKAKANGTANAKSQVQAHSQAQADAPGQVDAQAQPPAQADAQADAQAQTGNQAQALVETKELESHGHKSESLAGAMAVSKDHQWESKPEKRGLLGMEILLFIRKYFGTYAFKAVLFLVVGCFWAFDSKARLASNNWFKAVNDYKSKRGLPLVTKTSSLHHFYTFANAMYDKIAAWHGEIVLNGNAFMGDQNSLEIFNELSSRPKDARGVVILCCHLGNMEVCRALANKNGTIVNALMYTKNSQRFKEIMDKYIKVDDLNIIEVDSIDAYSAMVLDDKVAQGQFIAIAADRVAVSNKEAVCHVPFMDKVAAIPQGPFILANVLKCDVYLLFSTKDQEGIKIFFERFDMPAKLSRTNREAQLKELCLNYAQRLEYYAASYPEQWFNFYDYFINTDNEQTYGK